jgi:hypothetical protein
LKDFAFSITTKSTDMSVLKSLLLLLTISLAIPAQAQFNSSPSYRFLDVPVSARMTGLGGVNVSLHDRDVNFFYSNPALNGDTLQGAASVSYQFYTGDIGHSAITYAHKFRKTGVFTMGVQHMNYGMIQGYDATGLETGMFRSQETALMLSKSHSIRQYRFGATVKGIFSGYAGFYSTAIAIDLGGTFIHPRQQLSVGLAFRNLGFVLSDFSTTAASQLPFDVQVGSTFKPGYMPLRFSISAFHLAGQTINDKGLGEATTRTFVENIFSHLNVGAEILFHRNVHALIGYNSWKHRELKLENGGDGAGLSIGLAINIRTVDFVISRAGYVAGSATYSFTLSTDINKYLKRR